MRVRTRLAAVLAILVLGSTACDRPDGAEGSDGAPDADPADGGPSDADPTDGEPSCPSAFDACGGDLDGTWQILTFCPADGGSLTRPCESPWDDQAVCRGAPNEAICTTLYGGTIAFGSDGRAEVTMTMGFEVQYTLSPDCALAAAAGRQPAPTDPAEACASLGSDRIECLFADGLCRCEGGEPSGEGETFEDEYQAEGDHLVIGPTRSEPIAGPYCVDGDDLVIQGPIGWAYWVLARAEGGGAR
jgi:hypothetical protein